MNNSKLFVGLSVSLEDDGKGLELVINSHTGDCRESFQKMPALDESQIYLLEGSSGSFFTVVRDSGYHQKALAEICGSCGPSEKFIKHAVLEFSEDKYAAVFIEQVKIGSLYWEDARKLIKHMNAIGRVGQMARCAALVGRGWEHDSKDDGSIQVRLDIKEIGDDEQPNQDISNSAEFSFGVIRPDLARFNELGDGAEVDFWWPEENPRKMFVQDLEASLGGRIGLVPRAFAPVIVKQITDGKKFTATIEKHGDTSWRVKFRILTEIEARQKNIDYMRHYEEKKKTWAKEEIAAQPDKIRAQLLKPRKTPKLLFSVDGKGQTFVPGEKLCASKSEIDEDNFESVGGFNVDFTSTDGLRRVSKLDDFSVRKKLVQLFNSYPNIEVTVIAVEGECYWYQNEVVLEISAWRGKPVSR